MTPTETRNERLALHLIRHLEWRNMTAYYCPTAQEAVARVNELIPDGASVTWGGSMTVRDMGIPAALHARGTLDVMDRDLAGSREEAQAIYRKAFTAGNRVAAITFGPQHVIFVIGLNKVAQTADAALARARSTASPVNAARFDIQTPCHTDGVCHNCNAADCICNYIHFLRNSPGHRHTVILVGGSWGY